MAKSPISPAPKPAKGAGRKAKPVAAEATAIAVSTADKPAYFAPALEKGLDVLELLASLSEPVTPSQIAQRMGRSLQEVYRVVVALERRGYIVRPPGTEALILSTRLFGLATLFPLFRRVVDVAQPIINGLALESGQAVHVAVLDGPNMCIIAQVDSPAPIGVRLKVGAHSPAVRGASGRTLIAFQPPAVRDWFFSEAAATQPAEQLADDRKRVENIIERGYEMIDGSVLPGITDLSFPILNAEGFAIAAVTMPFLTSYYRPIPFEQAAALLQQAANRISAIMGGTVPRPRFPLVHD
jgi:DNA-binding IclR family transcriptional regulator